MRGFEPLGRSAADFSTANEKAAPDLSIGSGFFTSWCPEEAPTDPVFRRVEASTWVFSGYLLSSARRCRTKGSVNLLYGNVAGRVALEHALTAQLCDGVPIQTHHLRGLGNRHLRWARVARRVQAHGTFCGGGCRLLDQPLDVQIHDQNPYMNSTARVACRVTVRHPCWSKRPNGDVRTSHGQFSVGVNSFLSARGRTVLSRRPAPS